MLVRLKSVESFNEALAISEHARGKKPFREGSALNQLAEKVFLQQMEVIRLKYPTSLQRIRSEQSGALYNITVFGVKKIVNYDG